MSTIPVTVHESLATQFKEACEGTTSTRFFIVQIKEGMDNVIVG